jgi:protein SCO1/2
MMHTMTELQKRFSKNLGHDLWFISVTVDPENDTPEKLKLYAIRNLAKPGWSFLTGSRAEVDSFLKLIDQYVAKRDDHQALMIIGNDKTGLVMRTHALAPSKDVGDVVQKVLEGAQE